MLTCQTWKQIKSFNCSFLGDVTLIVQVALEKDFSNYCVNRLSAATRNKKVHVMSSDTEDFSDGDDWLP
jgi:hypothetical protein